MLFSLSGMLNTSAEAACARTSAHIAARMVLMSSPFGSGRGGAHHPRDALLCSCCSYAIGTTASGLTPTFTPYEKQRLMLLGCCQVRSVLPTKMLCPLESRYSNVSPASTVARLYDISNEASVYVLTIDAPSLSPVSVRAVDYVARLRVIRDSCAVHLGPAPHHAPPWG